jgi:ferredoxin
MNNIVFYFSGTGNSLKVAKSVIAELGGGEIVSMAKPQGYTLTKQYDTIGFVYPTYYWALPKIVITFIENIKITNNENAYFYAIATYGGNASGAITRLNELLLKNHNIKLNSGHGIKMFSNYVLLYNMRKKVDEITKESNERLVPILNSIKNKENNTIKKSNKFFIAINKENIKKVSKAAKDYKVSKDCSGCGICKEVCPVKNIQMVNNKPQFSNNCEQCVACIQYCPQKAINYKDKTQKRRRYTHPEISYKELAESNLK